MKVRYKVIKEVMLEKGELYDHALIGISPFNSYFSEENITSLIGWAYDTFSDFTVFIPEGWSIHTLMAKGYNEQKAKKKTKKVDAFLRNKVLRSFENNNISEEMAIKKILMANSLIENVNYTEMHSHCLERFNNNFSFKEMCLSASSFILPRPCERLNEIDIYTAVHYFLHELPLFLDTPKILGVPSSFVVYHTIQDFINHIYKDNIICSLNQGFIVAEVFNNKVI